MSLDGFISDVMHLHPSTGQPYPLRTGRIILLIRPDHAQAVTFG
jgi:hypothetical protein